MSLASLLLRNASESSKAIVDKDLDTLFQSNPAPPQPRPVPVPIAVSSNPSPDNRGQKRKRDGEHKTPHSKDNELPHNDATKRLRAEKTSQSVNKEQGTKKKETLKKANSRDMEEEDEDDSELEQQYFAQKASTFKKIATKNVNSESSEEEEEEEDPDAPPPVHETHKKPQKRSKNRNKNKYVPPDETFAQRDARTIFVGNVAVAVLTSKSVKNQLKSHIVDLVPEGKIESIRFRSVAFSAPTAKTEEENDIPSTKEKRQIERTAEWRNSQQGAEEKSKQKRVSNTMDETSDIEDSSKKPAHVALTPAARKRIAFIKHEFHQEVDTVNAYIVFAHTPPVDATTTTESSHDFEGTDRPVHPAEAARLAVERGDGTVFMERTIRVDRVGQWRAGLPEELAADADMKIDPRTTVFVGNLDFAAREEELRKWFEGVISKERGPPPHNESDGDSDGDSKKRELIKKRPNLWVKNVRIIRDKDTQLGKGFAYVRFTDRECVDELLNVESSQLKFAKRCLRIQRCKGIPGATPKSTAPLKVSRSLKPGQKSKDSPRRQAKPAPIVVPKGDPDMGSKLAGLSKEERKAAKAANVARVERRLAKKRAKTAVKLDKTGAEKLGRDRERRRKGDKVRKVKAKTKGRPRSEKAIEKRNAKK